MKIQRSMSTHRNNFRWELFDQLPVVGILRNVSIEEAAMILPVYIEAGFTTIEVPINSENSAELIRRLVLDFGGTLNIGAGSVIDLPDLQQALDAGAGFIVTPVIDEEVISHCVNEDIPIFPGAFSPTEVAKAWKLGAAMVKVFPAGGAGVDYIKALKEPLKGIKLLPTGGVSINNAKDYFLAGAQGLGVSTGLFKSELIRNKEWGKLWEHFVSFHRVIQNRGT